MMQEQDNSNLPVSNSYSRTTQVLALSLFLVLLVFFLGLVPHTQLKPEKTTSVLRSIEKTFAIKPIALPLIQNDVVPPALREDEAARKIITAFEILRDEASISLDIQRGAQEEILITLPLEQFFKFIETKESEGWAFYLANAMKNEERAKEVYRIDFIAPLSTFDSQKEIAALVAQLQTLADILETKAGFTKGSFSVSLAEMPETTDLLIVLHPVIKEVAP